MAEFVCVPTSAIHIVPDSIDPAGAAILETLGVAVHAMDLARPRLMETVAVLGCGPVGLLLIQLARLAGVSKIIAIDPVKARADLACSLGADVGCGSPEEAAGFSDGRGARPCHRGDGFLARLRACRTQRPHWWPPGHRRHPREQPICAERRGIRRKGLSIKFSRRMPEVYPRAIALAESGRVKLGPLATRKFSLDQTPGGVRTAGRAPRWYHQGDHLPLRPDANAESAYFRFRRRRRRQRGALANTVLAEVVTELGVPTTLEDSYRLYLGKRFSEIITAIETLRRSNVAGLIPGGVPGEDTGSLQAGARADSGVREFITRFGHAPRCIASSSSPDRLTLCLDVLDMTSLFEGRVFSASNVARGKPYPDIFLHASETTSAFPRRMHRHRGQRERCGGSARGGMHGHWPACGEAIFPRITAPASRTRALSIWRWIIAKRSGSSPICSTSSQTVRLAPDRTRHQGERSGRT